MEISGRYFQKIIDQKVKNRTLVKKIKTDNYLIFTEHNPVYTIGKSGDISKPLLDSTQLRKKEMNFLKLIEEVT